MLSTRSSDLGGAPARRASALVWLGIVSLMTAACLSARSGLAAGTIWYVSGAGSDSNPGTQAAPFRQIRRALAVARPGDTILVGDGSYLGFDLDSFPGTASSPLTIRAVGQNAVVTRTSDRPDNRDNILLTGCSYVVLDGLRSFNAPRAAVRVSWCRFVTVRNGVFGNNGVWGIFTDFSDDLLLERNECYGSAEQHGIYVSNSGDRPTVRGNISHDNRQCGIHMNGDLSSGGDGIISGGLVENNILYGNGAGGGAAINMDGVQNTVVRNNLIFNNLAGGITSYQIDGAQGPRGNQILHNTVDMPSSARWALQITATTGPMTVRNNILIHRNSYRGGIEFGSWTDVRNTDSRNNILDRVTPDFGNSIVGLAQWQTSGYEAGSLSATPASLWVNPGAGDYHLLANAPAKDRGETLASVTTDLDGRPRPAGAASDIGCYELPATSGDTTPPATPTGLTATAGDSRAILAWNANAESDLAGYFVYRSGTQSGTYARQNTTPLTAPAFTQTGLTNGTTYWYRVSAVDTSGNESAQSTPVSVTPTALTYSISGRVTLNGSGLSGVTVSAGSATATTAADGTYRIAGLAAGTYTVSASRTGYSFSAPQTVTVGPDRTGVDFTATVVSSGDETFVRGINLGGGAVTIEGNAWLSHAAALASGFSVTGGSTDPTYPFTPNPPVDADTDAMLHTNVWGSSSFTLSQGVENGSYRIYLWVAEDGADNARDMVVRVEGVTVASGIGELPLGGWRKYGPYSAEVGDGSLTVEVARGTKGSPQVMGLAIFRPASSGGSTVPAAPTNLAARILSGTQVRLTWRDNSTDESGFRIERKSGAPTAPGSYTLAGNAAANATAFTCGALTPGSTYTFRVCAWNAAGASGYSNTVTVTMPLPPAAPTNLTATVASATQVALVWSDNSDNENAFYVERKAGSGSFRQIAILPKNTTRYTAGGLTPGVTYTFRVRAKNLGGFSAYSNEASATTQ